MLHEYVETRLFGEPDQICAAQPGVFLEAVPLGTRPFEAELTTFRLGDMSLHLGCASPFMGFARVAPDRAVLQLPVRNVETLVLNGAACQPGVVGTYACNAELLRSNPQPSSHSALILPFDSVEKLLEPPPTSKILQPGSHALLKADPCAWKRTDQIIRAIREVADAVPDIFAAEQPRLALREALLHAAHDLIAPDGNAELRMPRSSRARRRIVVAADDYLRAHMDRPIYTEELCEVLAVSASSLAEAFRAVFVISPHRFLKLRRLSMVRASLRSPDGRAPLVKSVALSHGFWHLGQFAHDYRETFGETPSETLGRTRGGAVEAFA